MDKLTWMLIGGTLVWLYLKHKSCGCEGAHADGSLSLGPIHAGFDFGAASVPAGTCSIPGTC